MTGPLTTLLHDEADGIHVPPAPAAQVIAAGRGLRRRRTSGIVAGAVAAVLAVVGITIAVQHASQNDSIQPADQKAYVERGAWAVGDEVHVGNHVVIVRGLTSLSYTSLGALAWVQHPGKDFASTRSESLLITPEGEVQPVDEPGLEHLRVRGPASDPNTSLIVYPRATDDRKWAQLVVADLATGEARDVGQPYLVNADRTDARLLSLSGQVAVAQGDRGQPVRIDLGTGDRLQFSSRQVVSLSGYAGGRHVATNLDTLGWQVQADADAEVLLDVPYTGPKHVNESPSLSPDGRYFAVPTGESGIEVYSVATGDSVRLGGDRDVSDYGWTPDDHLVGKPLAHSDSEVEVCDPDTGRCEGTGVTVGTELTLVPGADALAPDVMP